MLAVSLERASQRGSLDSVKTRSDLALSSMDLVRDKVRSSASSLGAGLIRSFTNEQGDDVVDAGAGDNDDDA